jgi:hypothetical protein
MKIKVLIAFHGIERGQVGDVLDLPDKRALELIAAKLCAPLEKPKKPHDA